MEKITPCLWFDRNAEEAVAFYASVFPDLRVLATTRYPASSHPAHEGREGSVLTIRFEMNGQTFTALNGGPFFTMNEAVSFQLPCHTQVEIDYYWEKLGEGGDEDAKQCGWLKDKFGLSWQVMPAGMEALLQRDPDTAARVMSALLPMKKLCLATLQAAADAAPTDSPASNPHNP